MNGKGLGVNMLYLTETDFGTNPPADKPRISFVAWLQSIVSNYATVAEVWRGRRTIRSTLCRPTLAPVVRDILRCIFRSATQAAILP